MSSTTSVSSAVAPLVLAGGRVLTDPSEPAATWTHADVVIMGGEVVEIGRGRSPEGATRLDCAGMFVVPGYIDLQCNGARGIDLTSSPSAIGRVGASLVKDGVTAWLPTIVSTSAEVRHDAIEAQLRVGSVPVRSAPDEPRAQSLGLHLEGPVLAVDHAGAHDAAHIGMPEPREIATWCRSGVVRMVTLAPESPGAIQLTGELTAAGIVVSAGHTAMEPDDLDRAVAAGLRYVTHLYNAMSPLHHRRPGAVGATLTNDVVVAGLICDGVHLAPEAVRLARRALGPGRLSIVSDATAALDATPGPTTIGGRHISTDTDDHISADISAAGAAVRRPDGTLAGGAVGLDRAVRTFREITDCPVAEAIGAVTTTPARLLGLGRHGRLVAGSAGDALVVDEHLAVHATVVAGQVAWQA